MGNPVVRGSVTEIGGRFTLGNGQNGHWGGMAKSVDRAFAGGRSSESYRLLSQSWPWSGWHSIASLQSFYWLQQTGRFQEVVECVDSFGGRHSKHLEYFKCIAQASQSVLFPWFYRGRISRPSPALLESMRTSHPILAAVANALEYELSGEPIHLERLGNMNDLLLPGMQKYFTAMSMRTRHSHTEVRAAFDEALRENRQDCRAWQGYLTWEFRRDPSLSPEARAGLAICQADSECPPVLSPYFAYSSWVDNRRTAAVDTLIAAYDLDRCNVGLLSTIAVYLTQSGDKAGAKKWQKEAVRARAAFSGISEQLISRETWSDALAESKA